VRVRAKSDLLNARNITLDELAAAIKSANANTPLGTLDGPRQTLTIQANAQLMKSAEFADSSSPRATAIAGAPEGCGDGGGQLRVDQDRRQLQRRALDRAGWCSASPTPTRCRWWTPCAAAAAVPAQLPASININLVNDRSLSIREAIHDVNLTLALTVLLVVLVIFLFLRRADGHADSGGHDADLADRRAGLLYGFGYSLDNVSLLGITLAVGLVVDDAIVVLENIVRHIEMGMKPHAGGAGRLARDGLHHYLDLDLAGGGVHPDLLHAGRDRPAVP
jgi:HAE1 family hydrophobic/amphiphilic exporter-1